MPYLKNAVESILQQTYKNFEFIILNDASRDESQKYLESLKDQRIKLIINKKNLGIARSLNKTLEVAKGRFIARMDADDISLPRRLEEQLVFLKKHPKIDLCGTWVDLIDSKGKTVGEKKYPTKSKDVKKSICWHTAVIHPTFMGKKTFFEKIGGYRINYDFAEDYDLLQRAKKKFAIVNIPKKLLLWRLQKNRRSRKNMQKIDKVDLKIKIEALKRDGLTTDTVCALLWKILVMYLLPAKLKVKIAVILNRA